MDETQIEIQYINSGIHFLYKMKLLFLHNLKNTQVLNAFVKHERHFQFNR